MRFYNALFCAKDKGPSDLFFPCEKDHLSEENNFFYIQVFKFVPSCRRKMASFRMYLQEKN
eukprot:TRINITY_DN637_c0_g1_i1.p2 TRINITY_DN637_c0_g1~~TRINITY_DN637_c0_g1_i1.p2  ORF type:complete len:61 (-),score=5.82 TRINITY_DN637_c0_g1_i1:109-291(-)